MRHLLIIVALALITSCVKPDTSSMPFEHIDGDVWHSDYPIEIVPQWSDSAATYTMLITVRHTQAYPYANLPMTLDMIGDSGQVKRQRLNVDITDGHGNWVGQGFGTLYQRQVVALRGVKPRQANRVKLWMALEGCDSVLGVSDMGITLIIEH